MIFSDFSDDDLLQLIEILDETIYADDRDKFAPNAWAVNALRMAREAHVNRCLPVEEVAPWVQLAPARERDLMAALTDSIAAARKARHDIWWEYDNDDLT